MDNDPLILTPPGQLLVVDGRQVHFQYFRCPTPAPTIVFETGLTMMSACWGWLAPLLAPHANLLLYDRAGLGWSESRSGIRDAQALARELHSILATLSRTETSFSPPFLFLGHSLGALINRAYFKLFPAHVRGMLWLDPSHPDQLNRNRAMSRRIKQFFFWLEAAQLLARNNIPKIELPLLHQIKGLPPASFQIAKHFLRDPGHLRGAALEARAWESSCAFVRGQNMDAVPLLLVSAQKHAMPGWTELQNDLATLSSNTTHLVLTDASHVSLLTTPEQSRLSAQAIIQYLRRF